MPGLFGALAAPSRKQAATLDTLPGFLIGPESSSGVPITWTSALQVTAMFACARVVSEGLAQCRARLMRPRKGADGADAATDHPLYRLLYLEPFPGQTAFEFWTSLIIHTMLVGNAYVFINRVGKGRIKELILLQPNQVTVNRQNDLTLRYQVTESETGITRDLPASSIWHIRGPSWNGWMGMETIRLAREALGLSIALEESHARLHKDGLQQAGAYSVEGSLTPDQYNQLAAWLKRFSPGGDMAGRAMILDKGAKWLSQTVSSVDLQHLETRRLQVEEVCRAARVMPIMVGLSEKTATYASAEQMFLAHVMHTLAPWAGRLEQSAEVALLTDQEKDQGLELRFDLNQLQRGDFKGRQDGLAIMRDRGVINANTWLAMEGMNPRTDPGGKQYIVAANMAVQDGRPDLTPIKPGAAPANPTADPAANPVTEGQ